MPKAIKERFIIELKLNTNNYNEFILNKRFEISRGIYNKTLKYAKTQLKRMKENKVYKVTFNQYLIYKKANDKDNIKLYEDLLKSIRLSYNLSEYGLHDFVKVQQHMYKKHIDSHTAQKIASTVWKAVESVLFKKGKKLHFKKHGELSSIEGKSNKSGIRFINNKLSWNKLNIDIKTRENDLFIKESLTYPIKYCRIIKKTLKNGHNIFYNLLWKGYLLQRK